jgi:hypothetical protein
MWPVPADSLDSELDRLYALEPGAFVSERDRIARELREAGRHEDAEQVKGLRKPTVSAWAINQLARQERREVDLLLDAGHRLREAQQGLLAGEDRRSLDEARRNEREALAGLREAARRILAEQGRVSETALSRITGTLQAAAVSSEGRELLARGRLTGDIEATGFELLAPLSEGTQRQTMPKATRKIEDPQAHERLETARARLREAQETAKAAEKDQRAAEREADKARRELAQAEKRAEKLKADAAKAREAVKEAEKQAREAGNARKGR